MSAKVKIILTNDYEILGSGEGDIFNILLNPTDKMHQVADSYQVPITHMLELAEYWAFEKEYQKGNLPTDFAELIKKQLIQAVQTQHDVQLHIHPQWLNYQYLENKWLLDYSQWRTSSLNYNTLLAYFKQAKTELESWFQPIDKFYECIAFRAGAWCIQPEKLVLKALVEAGFKYDTSVARNIVYDAELTKYNFTHTPNLPYWRIEDNVLTENKLGKLIELPVPSIRGSVQEKFSTIIKSRFKKYQLNSTKEQQLNRPAKNKSISNKNQLQKTWQYKIIPQFKSLDFCKHPPKQLIKIIDHTVKKFNQYPVLPIIGVGHSKEFTNPENFEQFLNLALEKGYEFSTFRAISKDLYGRKN